jgi:hypothetical protein
MSKKSDLSPKAVSDIAQQLGDHIKKSGRSFENGERKNRITGNKGIFFWGAASGIAVMLAAPLLRPAARTIVKAGIKAGRQAQQIGATLKEEFEDITAEARAELDSELPPESHEHPETA